jgi:hypothetical protein
MLKKIYGYLIATLLLFAFFSAHSADGQKDVYKAGKFPRGRPEPGDDRIYRISPE